MYPAYLLPLNDTPTGAASVSGFPVQTPLQDSALEAEHYIAKTDRSGQRQFCLTHRESEVDDTNASQVLMRNYLVYNSKMVILFYSLALRFCVVIVGDE
jgi:hypothetical protein